MSMHKIELTKLEEMGLIAHGLGDSIGIPCQEADFFRLGIRWALMSKKDRYESIMQMIQCGLPVDVNERRRLEDLIMED